MVYFHKLASPELQNDLRNPNQMSTSCCDLERLLVRGQTRLIARKLEGVGRPARRGSYTQKKGSRATSPVKRRYDTEPAESWIFPDYLKHKESSFKTQGGVESSQVSKEQWKNFRKVVIRGCTCERTVKTKMRINTADAFQRWRQLPPLKTQGLTEKNKN